MEAMDDAEAYVETEGEEDIIASEEKRFQHTPEASTAQSIFQVILRVNPWWYVLVLGFAYWLYRRFQPQLDQRWSEWKERREVAKEAAEMKKNPDAYRARMEAVEAHRRRLQERYNADAAAAQERARTEEEEKRMRKVEELESLMKGQGYRNKKKVEEAEWRDGVQTGQHGRGGSGRRVLRPDYNPLMGSGGGSGYRPERRNVGGGSGGG